MDYKRIFQWVPKRLLLGIFTMTLVLGLNSIIIAEIVSFIAEFNQSNNRQDIVLFLVFSITALLIIYFAYAINMHLVFKAINILNKKFKQKFIIYQLRNQQFLNDDNNKKITLLLNDFKLIEEKYFQPFFQMMFYIPTILFAMGYLIYVNPYLGVAFILLNFLTFLPTILFGKHLNKNTKAWTTANEQFLQHAKDSFTGTHVIQTYQVEDSVLMNVRDHLIVAEKSFRRMIFTEEMMTTLSAYVSFFSQLVPILFALLYVINGSLEASAIIAMHTASNRMSNPLETLVGLYTQIKSTEEIRKNASLFLKEDSKLHPTKNPTMVNKPTIHIQEMTFSYEETKEAIFEKVTVEIAYGEKVVLTGPSGSGKTTIFHLLQGFLKPDQGFIFYQDKQKKISAEESLDSNLFARIGQEPFLFSDTLFFNLTLGQDYSKEACLEVLKQVDLLDELGLNCLMKNYGENGKNLSGGQKQRVEIARALLHNKQIILVDEATSALDRQTAKKIREILWTLPQTVIEIAHHFNREDLKKYDLVQYDLKNKTFIQK